MRKTSESSINCPILIGRDQCIARFARAFASVVEGTGGTFTISGEAGVGKSRLVNALAAEAAQLSPDVRVLQGHCFERDASIPFAPFVDLWRSFALKTDADELRATFQGDAGDLDQAVTGVAQPLPG